MYTVQYTTVHLSILWCTVQREIFTGANFCINGWKHARKNFRSFKFRTWPQRMCRHTLFSWTSTFIVASVKISCSFFVLLERLRKALFEIEAMVRGYHIYKDVWSAVIDEELLCKREDGNRFDPFAVAVCNGDIVIGHVPRKISSVCSLYIRRGGEIHCRVTGSRRFSAD